MKMLKQALLGMLAVSGSYFAISAQATETINVSYAAAAVTGFDNCVALGDLGWTDADPYQQNNVNGCRIEFAMPVPAGHLIRQISLSYLTSCDQNQPCFNNTLQTSAYVIGTAVSGGGAVGPLFYWSSTDPVLPLGSIKQKALMGKADTFVAQANLNYHVTVEIHNFDAVTGMQVTYD